MERARGRHHQSAPRERQRSDGPLPEAQAGEESFRIAKHDLKVRLIWYWNSARIRAHIAIAFMAVACVRHLAYRVTV